MLSDAGMYWHVLQHLRVWLGTLYTLVGGSVPASCGKDKSARIGSYRFGLRKCVVPAAYRGA